MPLGGGKTEEVLLIGLIIVAALVILRRQIFPGGWGLDSESSSGKTVWDWLSLLGVPLSLALLGAWFQRTQQEQSVAAAKAQQEQAEKLAKEQREQAASETEEDVLQIYFDRISVLLVDKNLLGIAARQDISLEEQELLSAAADVIRSRTLSILRRFSNDKERKTSVIQFLVEAGVINKLKLSLKNADLSHAELSLASLSHTDLNGVNLNGAELSFAILKNAEMNGAQMNGAILKGAQMNGAQMNGAILKNAELNGADLRKAGLQHANLSSADLRGTVLRGSDLSYADLNGAKLGGAKLIDTVVKKTKFGLEHGLSEEKKQELIKRGAIFDDEQQSDQ